MISARKLGANRENAKRSTGPKTPDGKTASSKNAISHGLSSTFKVLPHEDAEAFAALLASLTAEHEPETGQETFLVRQMAESQWRLNRTRAYESIAWGQLIGEVDETNPEERIVARMSEKVNNIFDLLRRYANDAERSWYRASREMSKLRSAAKQNKAIQAEQEAEAWLHEQIEETEKRFRDSCLQDTIATPVVHWPEYRSPANAPKPETVPEDAG
jgi:hypothetical protein